MHYIRSTPTWHILYWNIKQKRKLLKRKCVSWNTIHTHTCTHTHAHIHSLERSNRSLLLRTEAAPWWCWPTSGSRFGATCSFLDLPQHFMFYIYSCISIWYIICCFTDHIFHNMLFNSSLCQWDLYIFLWRTSQQDGCFWFAQLEEL